VKKLIIIGIIVIIVMTPLLAFSDLITENLIQDKAEKVILISDSVKSTQIYTYNIICELGSNSEEIFLETLFPVMFELTSGVHNNNQNLINYINTLEHPSRPNLTPELLFPVRSLIPEGQILGNSYDTTHFDMIAMLPFILVIMDTSPEINEILIRNFQETNTDHISRVQTAILECQ